MCVSEMKKPEIDIDGAEAASTVEPAVSQSSSPRSVICNGTGSGEVGSIAEDQVSDKSEELACPRVKFMCSYGGKILPRPHDGQLRYVGGETRIFVTNRSISFAEFMSKLVKLVGRRVLLKYQLPNEDLDALISVVLDEDFDNMLDEYDKLEARDSSARLRLFLFFAKQPFCDCVGDLRNAEQHFIEALNGITSSSRKHHEETFRSASSKVLNAIGESNLPEPLAPQSVYSLPFAPPYLAQDRVAPAPLHTLQLPSPPLASSSDTLPTLKPDCSIPLPCTSVSISVPPVAVVPAASAVIPSPPLNIPTPSAHVSIIKMQRQLSGSDRNNQEPGSHRGSPRASPKANVQEPWNDAKQIKCHADVGFGGVFQESRQQTPNGLSSRENPANLSRIQDIPEVSTMTEATRPVFQYYDPLSQKLVDVPGGLAQQEVYKPCIGHQGPHANQAGSPRQQDGIGQNVEFRQGGSSEAEHHRQPNADSPTKQKGHTVVDTLEDSPAAFLDINQDNFKTDNMARRQVEGIPALAAQRHHHYALDWQSQEQQQQQHMEVPSLHSNGNSSGHLQKPATHGVPGVAMQRVNPPWHAVPCSELSARQLYHPSHIHHRHVAVTAGFCDQQMAFYPEQQHLQVVRGACGCRDTRNSRRVLSPSRFREHFHEQSDDRLLRPVQQHHMTESVGHFVYDSAMQNGRLVEKGAARMAPHYAGPNPFQDSVPFQDATSCGLNEPVIDTRRHHLNQHGLMS